MLISFSYSNLRNFEFKFRSLAFEFQKLGLGFRFGLWLNSLRFRDSLVVIKLSILILQNSGSVLFKLHSNSSPIPLLEFRLGSILPVRVHLGFALIFVLILIFFFFSLVFRVVVCFSLFVCFFDFSFAFSFSFWFYFVFGFMFLVVF